MSLMFFIAFASVAAATYLVAEAAMAPSRARRSAVGRAGTYGRRRRGALIASSAIQMQQSLTPIKDGMARWVLRLTPKLTVEDVSRKLLAAGLTRRLSPTGFLALKGCGALLAVLLGALIGGKLLFALIGGAACFFAPDAYLTVKMRKRREEARRQLPDALDILAVSVEAGLAFDGAISKLVEHMHGALPEEFALTLGEMRIGRSRHEALKNLSERVDAPEITAFVRALIQADQLGISLGKILRVQAADTRMRRQAAAEEKAMKAPIKMIPPTAIFIFPAIFIVALGPALLSLGDVF